MQTHALAAAGFAIPPRPQAARSPQSQGRPETRPVLAQSATAEGREAALRWWRGLGPLQEASLVGSVGLLCCWGLAELALWLGGV
jgi:hypothetical protein